MPDLFVGREQELRALGAALDAAPRGEGKLVLVSGEPGIGKTRLAEELCRRAEAARFVVAWGRSWEGEGTPAYWPWLQALRSLAAQPVFSPRFEAARASSAELAALLGEGADEGRSAVSDPERARFKLFDAIAQLLKQLAAESPLLIVLDDLHAADVSSLMLLAFLARDLRGTRMIVLATARDTSFQVAPAAEQLLAKVSREAEQVALQRLAKADLVQWVGAALPALADRIDNVFDTSEGNPLYIQELLAAAHKRSAGAWTSAQLLPQGIRGAVREHLALLSPAARQLLEAASVLGRDFSFAALHALAPGAEHDKRALLEEAMASRILSQLADGQLHFGHVLLRDELYAGIEGARRAELHRAAGAWLSREASHAAAAHHWLLGARAEDTALACGVVLAAMRHANARLAYEDAAQLGERALAALAAQLAPADQAALLIAIGEAKIIGGAGVAGKAACSRAADLAASIGDGELLARAALLFGTEITLGRREPTVQILRRALAALPHADSALRAEVLARLSVALVPARPEEGDEPGRLGREAVAMSRRLGDDAKLFAPLRLATTLFPEAFGVRERLAVNAESLALEQKLGQVPRVVPLLASRIASLLEAGDAAGAAAAVEAADKALKPFEKPHYRWRAPLLRAMFAGLQGRFAEADDLGREALRTCQKHELADGLNLACIQRMMLQFNRGDDQGFAELEPIVIGAFGATPGAAIFFSLADAICGRPDRARALLEQVRQLDLAELPGAANLGWVCVEAGADEHAGFFHELVRAHPSTMLFGPGTVATMGPTALLLGRLAAMLGRGSEAEQHYQVAHALCRKLGAGPYEAQTELAWARELARRGAPEARTRAEAALAGAEQLGMTRVAERARELLGTLSSAPRPAEPQPAARPAEPQPAARRSLAIRVTRQGEMWSISGAGSQILLKDTKGLAFLELLVQSPDREIHVLELVGADAEGDAGPMLDQRAKLAYRARAEALREDLEEATNNGDLGRAERAREELEKLAEELARAVGLGGRDRRAASGTERARVNVQRRVKDVIRRVTEQDKALGRHLELSVRTGNFCRYTPTWSDA